METDYLDGFQYKFTYAWEDETFTMVNDELRLRIIPTFEGYFDALLGLYVYNYVDHLGNVRISYADSDHDGIIRGRDQRIKECHDGNCVDYFKPGEIVSNNTYYPFGMLFDHQYQASNENAYKYKYNRKELQETGMYDYSARFYMPDLGRWGVIDPLAEISRRFTPYHYGNNSPIRFIDPDGRSTKKFDEKAEKTAQSIEKKLDKKIESLNKGNDVDKNDKIAELTKSKKDISDMRNDEKNFYSFAKAKDNPNQGAPETVRTGEDQITMYTDDFSKQIHESRHGGQIARGEYDLNKGGVLKSGVFGINQEIDAYRAQYSYDGQLIFPTLPSGSYDFLGNTQGAVLNRQLMNNNQFPVGVQIRTVNNISGINASTVRSIVELSHYPGNLQLNIPAGNYLKDVYDF